MDSKEYWGKRLADKTYKHNSEDMIKQLRKIYRAQAKDIRQRITNLYADMLADGEISTTNLYAYGRYTELIREINKILNKYGEKEEKVINRGLERAYKDVFNRTSESLGKSVKWGLQNTYVMEEVVNANFKGDNYSRRIWRNRDNLAKKIEKNLQDIVASGISKDKAVSEIMRTENSSFANTDRLVRTETMRVINSGQLESYKQNGYTEYYVIVAKDERLCPECMRLDGQTFKIEEARPGENMPPYHPRCRCTVRPVTKIKSVYEHMQGNTVKGLAAKETDNKYIEPPKPEYVEKIDTSNPNVIKSKLKEYEKQIVNEPVEHAYCILSNGEVYKFKGDKDSVNPMALGDKLKGAVVTHNHPKEETQYSFSDYDVGLFLENGIKTLRGCDNKYIYEITSTGETPAVSTDTVIYEFGGELYKEALQIAYDKGLNFDEDLAHIEVECLAKKYNFKYKREKR